MYRLVLHKTFVPRSGVLLDATFFLREVTVPFTPIPGIMLRFTFAEFHSASLSTTRSSRSPNLRHHQGQVVVLLGQSREATGVPSDLLRHRGRFRVAGSRPAGRALESVEPAGIHLHSLDSV